ncbi:MAG: Na+/H+ antiporter NhaA [Caldilineaceae bacterium SB0665_bin_25]|nr:Na+/H+ antiporter NhaA [Caldilineaceae bacterium SB0665_bin_25]
MSTLPGLFSTLLKHEAAGGVLLMLAAAAALVLDNSPLAHLYDALLTVLMVVQIGGLALEKPLLLWINDGLMALFFLLVGLEMKREFLDGNLSSWRQALQPALAALGGMAAPALIYAAFNAGDQVALRGWAIPAATDIAFAIGILALLGKRVPAVLKVFLLTVAVIDDLGAILIIAAFYTAELSLASLAIAGACTVVLLALNLGGVTRLLPYILVGVVMWVAVLKSGVHATLAGVVIALFIPLRTGDASITPPLMRVEHGLHGFVALFVMPIFAFANAGVHLGGLSFGDFLSPIPLGIAAGLFFGNQIGIFGLTWAGVRFGLCRLPKGVTWLHVYGASALAGVGFTMSLFIGTLAFDDPANQSAVRIGVLSGSLLSGLVGYVTLRWLTGRAHATLSREPRP